MKFEPGQHVFIKECITEQGPQPALMGTVVEDHEECVEVRLWKHVTNVPGAGTITQWTDPDDEVQDFLHEFVVPVIGEKEPGDG